METRPGRESIRPAVMLAAVVLPCAGLLLAGELGLRAYHALRHGDAIVSALVPDDTLGFGPAPGYRLSTDVVDAAGNPYRVEATADEHGHRHGGPPSRPVEVLFVGDSFSQASKVSDADTYAARVGASLGVHVVTVAAGGWGTLQEVMALERVLERVHPRVVVLQFCENDFINNDHELELASNTNTNHLPRPYLLPGGRVEIRVPSRFPTWRALEGHLRLVHFVATRIDRLNARNPSPPTPPDAWTRAVGTTGALLSRVRAAVPADVPVLAFDVSTGEPAHGTFRALAAAAGLQVLEGVPEAVLAAEQRGVVTRGDDGAHWSAAGHGVVAGVLGPAVRTALGR